MVALDMHAHVSVPEVDALLAGTPGLLEQQRRDAEALGEASLQYNLAHIGELAESLSNVDLRIAAMDKAGINVQAVSPVPIPHLWADRDLAQQIVSLSNAAVSAHCELAPRRLIGIAIVSLQHPDLAIQQLKAAVSELDMRGVQIATNAGEHVEFDDPKLDDFWSAATDLDIPVLIHPWGCSLGARLNLAYMFNTVGNPTETTLALSRLIFGGVMDRHPALRIWAAHGGGFLPSYAGRADHAWRVRSDARTCRHPPSSYLRRMWFDALVFDDQSIRHLVASVGAQQITLGTDYPFDMGVTDPIARVRRSGIPPDAARTICEVSALNLLGTRSLTIGRDQAYR